MGASCVRQVFAACSAEPFITTIYPNFIWDTLAGLVKPFIAKIALCHVPLLRQPALAYQVNMHNRYFIHPRLSCPSRKYRHFAIKLDNPTGGFSWISVCNSLLWDMFHCKGKWQKPKQKDYNHLTLSVSALDGI